jgi:hypothetical protein
MWVESMGIAQNKMPGEVEVTKFSPELSSFNETQRVVVQYSACHRAAHDKLPGVTIRM